MSKHIPLTAMQKAYLLGKSKQFPLSHSSMHDFREFRGTLSYKALIESLTRLISCFSTLRTKIDENSLTQTVLDEISLKDHFDFIDLSLLNLLEANNRLEVIRHEYKHYLHQLGTPPWRMAFIQMPQDAEDKTVIFTSFDGLIIDGFSISLCLEHLFNPKIEPLELSNGEITHLKTEVKEVDKQFWQNELGHLTDIPQFPWEIPLEKIANPRYLRSSTYVEYHIWQKFSKIASQQRILPNALLTTIILETLSKWNEDREVLVSIPISNTAIQDTVSNHSSFVVLHYKHEERLFLNSQNVQKKIMQAMAHSSFSGVDISKQLIQQTQASIVLPIALTNGFAWKKPVDHQEIRYIAGQTQTPQLALDIRLSFASNNDLVIDLDYVEQAISENTVDELRNALKTRIIELTGLESLENTQDKPRILPPLEISEVSQLHVPSIESYLERIERNLFNSSLHKTALVYNGKNISYEELANNILKIRQAFETLGLKEKQVVAICLSKCPEHIYVTLACALSNIIWLPVDMDSPEVRRKYILENSRVDLVVGEQPFENLPFLNIHDALELQHSGSYPHWTYLNDSSPTYYLYTSGSTGIPKCVVLNNLATSNTIQQSIDLWAIDSKDVHLAATPFHHDMSLFDIFVPLSVGGTLIIPTLEQAKSAIDWGILIEQYCVSIWCTVPAMADMLLTATEPHQLKSLRLISQGGDYVKPSVIQKFRQILPTARLISIGGPTETTILSIWHDITLEDQNIIPYGKPIAHNTYYILNQQGEPCPIGVVGQMYMTGVNLSNGYLLNGELKQQDFCQLNTEDGEFKRAYRTSDRGYVNKEGVIIFAGRNDGYLKIRGVRIAASEVENALMKHTKIKDCVVMTCTNPMFDGNELVAVYQCNDVEIHEANTLQLRSFLLKAVPNSHVPTRWLCLTEFPITRNGKVDRKELQRIAQETIYKKYVQAEPAKDHQLHEVITLIESVIKKPIAMDEQILSVGLTPQYINQVAKRCTSHFNCFIDYYTLAKSNTVNEIVTSIRHQLKLNH